MSEMLLFLDETTITEGEEVEVAAPMVQDEPSGVILLWSKYLEYYPAITRVC